MRTYGTTARHLLQLATEGGYCTQDSFSSFVSAALRRGGQEGISRAMVGSWESGRENIPGDVLGLLLRHVTPPQARELLQAFADRLGLQVVIAARPEGLVTGEEPLVLVGHATGAVGDLARAIVAEIAADSPGGSARTREELATRKLLLRRVRDQLDRLEAETDAELTRAA